uniref:EBV gH n=1 Tax=Epstein-Barr virus (strain GD1) TaxID=10376 RepID=UPI002E2E8A0E|nr:Chain A, EBV gH [human gammaherpesvirus 4]
LSEVKLHLDIEGHASHYTIPWTELMAKVPGLSPEALWREANVTEDLASMLNRYKLIYKTSGTLGIALASAPLEKQLFYYIGTMLPNTRPHSYVFYQLRCHLSYVALSINGDKFQYTGAMTSKFLMGTYKRVTEKGDEHVLSLVFGKTKDLPDLRGPFSYPSLTSAQSGDYSLVIVTTFVHYANFHNYFVPNLKDMFSRAVT